MLGGSESALRARSIMGAVSRRAQAVAGHAQSVTGGARVRRRVSALFASSHPLPALAETAFAGAVAASSGRGVGGAGLVTATVLTGQLSIGWSNDLIDRARDAAAGRQDKPLALGRVRVRTVAAACALALTCCVPLSFANGWRAGSAHLVAVAGGWAYNLGLKRTLASWLPYAVSFSLLTAFLALGLPDHPAPATWFVVAGALLGVGAHFLNVVPDIADDLAADVRGLPQRLGGRRSAMVGAGLLMGATVAVTVGPGPPVPARAWVGLAVALVVAGWAAGSARAVGGPGRQPRTPFLLAVVTAAIAVALVVARGSEITSAGSAEVAKPASLRCAAC